jgi:hypothetical protein
MVVRKKVRKKKQVVVKPSKKAKPKQLKKRKEILKPVAKIEGSDLEEELDVIKQNLQDQIDHKLPKNLHIADASIPDKKTYYVWVRGKKEYPRLKFTCVDESEAIRQYRQIVDIKNPSRQNYGVEKHKKE